MEESMSSTLSRRAVLEGLAASVAVGWSASAGSWVTAADAPATDVATVPPLDGVLETAPAVLGRFAHDFGNIRGGTPRAVLRPGSVNDIVKMVRFARQAGLTIAMNGQSGTGADLESHSNYGQAAVPGGIAIDARALSRIHSVSATSAVVDAGVTWAAVLDAALARGLTPPALTDYVHLSVGGTVSVGGIGGTVQKYGLLCDTVQEIEVVTGTGEVLTASATVRPALFNAVLAGGGQCGIIVKAKVKLVPAPQRVVVFNLFYNDLPTYMADQEKILRDGRFSHQEGAIVRTPDDSGWRYQIEAGYYYSGPTVPDQGALLAGLRDDRASLQSLDLTYREWVFRLDPFEVFLKEGGFWDQPHPWYSVVMPASRTRRFIESMVAELTPGDLGVGFAGFYPFRTSKLTRPLFALPTPAEPVAYLVDLLRFPFPDDPGVPAMLEQNRRLYDRAVALGGKRYLVGAIPGMTQADWRRHFGALYTPFRLAKAVYDPGNVLTPGQGFFA
jgi:FAD/FMN-containing dehydrogenase